MESAIKAWVEGVALAGLRVVETRTLTGGYSNDNTALTMDDGGRYVLRRYRGANRCRLETAIARRLAGVVPVAEVVAADPGGEVAGEPVLLSRFVEGEPVGELLEKLDEDALAELGHDVGVTLARIGSVEFARPGFFTAGQGLEPDGVEPTEGLDLFVERCLREGNAGGHLGEQEQSALREWAARAARELAVLKGSRRLVHSDYNPKNLLAVAEGGRWRVAAVLDWEFAFSSSPLVDVGNMLRFPTPHAYADGFVAGFRDGGGALPEGWRRLSRALDLFALADFLTRPVDHRYFGRAIERIRALVAAG
ncbi:phosphotransferase family protein [Actinoplanes sp. URMC 104]|uniref:phosphotransferase family protein n=1 Tax=Actinoplanes sp. URMC 104 TaxID=3423409 RepID=UPI003F1D87C2